MGQGNRVLNLLRASNGLDIIRKGIVIFSKGVYEVKVKADQVVLWHGERVKVLGIAGSLGYPTIERAYGTREEVHESELQPLPDNEEERS